MYCCLLQQTNTPLTASFPGQSGYPGTKKVKPIQILMKQEMMGWQWDHQRDHANHCHLTADRYNHARNSSLDFYRTDAHPDNQPQYQNIEGKCQSIDDNYYNTHKQLFIV